jgi:hypothetical protein
MQLLYRHIYQRISAVQKEDAGELIAVIVSAMANYKPEKDEHRGVAQCQYCKVEMSLLAKVTPHPHNKQCPVTLANRLLIALGKR